MECARCGVQGNKTRLFEVIKKEGLINLCSSCIHQEDLPIVRKPTQVQLKESEKSASVYERLSKLSGYDSEKAKREEKTIELINQETSLRSIVERNYSEKLAGEKNRKARADLIDNFHWKLMVARRKQKLTQAQLAEKIGEPEIAIKLAENGILPEGDYMLVNKLEKYLDLVLVKPGHEGENRGRIESVKPVLNFGGKDINNLKISDLQRIKEEKERQRVLEEERKLFEEVKEAMEKQEK